MALMFLQMNHRCLLLKLKIVILHQNVTQYVSQPCYLIQAGLSNLDILKLDIYLCVSPHVLPSRKKLIFSKSQNKYRFFIYLVQSNLVMSSILVHEIKILSIL